MCVGFWSDTSHQPQKQHKIPCPCLPHRCSSEQRLQTLSLPRERHCPADITSLQPHQRHHHQQPGLLRHQQCTTHPSSAHWRKRSCGHCCGSFVSHLKDRTGAEGRRRESSWSLWNGELCSRGVRKSNGSQGFGSSASIPHQRAPTIRAADDSRWFRDVPSAIHSLFCLHPAPAVKQPNVCKPRKLFAVQCC